MPDYPGKAYNLKENIKELDMSEDRMDAYEAAGVVPGDHIEIRSSDGSLRRGYPWGALVISPEKTREIDPHMGIWGDTYVYVLALPDCPPDSVNGFAPKQIITSGYWFTVIGREQAEVSIPITSLKEQNDKGGNGGKCVSCSGTLKAWTYNRYHCPVCEP